MLVGSYVSGAANIAYPLTETNVFILGKPDLEFVKMVKIRVTGEYTFDWLEAKYIADYPEECGKQSTFHEGCFFKGNNFYSFLLLYYFKPYKFERPSERSLHLN